MRNENTGRKMSKTVGHRKKLSDITNTPLLQKSRADDENDQLSKESSAQLQDELANVKKVLAEKDTMLAEKEQHIEENKRCMEKLWINYCRKTKQNDEIILHNSQLSKDLMQACDKLKVLEHEKAQMSALYKICKSEMQGVGFRWLSVKKQAAAMCSLVGCKDLSTRGRKRLSSILQKLSEALEEVDRLTKLLEASRVEKASADKHPPPVDSADGPGEDCTSIHGSRSALRKRQRKSYKEPSLKQKMRQADGNITCSGEPSQCDDNAALQKLGKAEECIAVSASSKTEIETSEAMACSGDNGAHTEASQECTGKSDLHKDQVAQFLNTLYVSTRKSCERPLRRAASSIGSYKEPLLNTKMRRAA